MKCSLTPTSPVTRTCLKCGPVYLDLPLVPASHTHPQVATFQFFFPVLKQTEQVPCPLQTFSWISLPVFLPLLICYSFKFHALASFHLFIFLLYAPIFQLLVPPFLGCSSLTYFSTSEMYNLILWLYALLYNFLDF